VIPAVSVADAHIVSEDSFAVASLPVCDFLNHLNFAFDMLISPMMADSNPTNRALRMSVYRSLAVAYAMREFNSTPSPLLSLNREAEIIINALTVCYSF
jgi:hypothetical protein